MHEKTNIPPHSFALFLICAGVRRIEFWDRPLTIDPDDGGSGWCLQEEVLCHYDFETSCVALLDERVMMVHPPRYYTCLGVNPESEDKEGQHAFVESETEVFEILGFGMERDPEEDEAFRFSVEVRVSPKASSVGRVEPETERLPLPELWRRSGLW